MSGTVAYDFNGYVAAKDAGAKHILSNNYPFAMQSATCYSGVQSACGVDMTNYPIVWNLIGVGTGYAFLARN